MIKTEITRWPRDSKKSASGKPGAVQTVYDGGFVYVFRNRSGLPIYVGRGGSTRPLDHTGPGAHNSDLTEFLKGASGYSIEIAGPFDPQVAALVEAALISAFALTPSIEKHLRNKIEGVDAGTFRPLGVPTELKDRLSLPALTTSSLKETSGGTPILVVYVGNKPFSDRPGIDLAHLPSESDIRNRMVKWWQLGRRNLDAWGASPDRAPTALIAVSGTPEHRIVVGSLEIDKTVSPSHWAKRKGELYEVAVIDSPTLDFRSLRGRRLAPGVATFGRIRSEFFKLI